MIHGHCKGYCGWAGHGAECGTSRGSKEERIRIPCGYGLIYRVTDIINKTEIGKYVSVRVRYRVMWHASAALVEGGSGAMAGRER